MPNITEIGTLIVRIKAEDAKETTSQIKDVQETTKAAGQESKRQIPILERMGRRWGAVLGLVAASGAVAFGLILKSSPSVMGALKGIQLAFEDIFGQIGEELSPIFNAVEDAVNALADAFNNLSPNAKTFIAAVVLGVIVVAGLAAAIIGLVSAASIIGVSLATLVVGLGAVAAGIIALSVVMAYYYTAWKNNWFGIRDIAKRVWDWVEMRFTQLMDILTDENKTMFQKVVSVWGLLKDIANEIWTGIKTIISTQIKKAYDYVVDMFNAMKAALRATIRYFVLNPIVRVIKTVSKKIEGRQFGGPVSAGAAYMVGEVGPELFTPNVSGAITPNNRISDKKSSPAASSSAPININMELKLDGRTVWESVRRHSAAEIRRLGG